MQKLLFRVRALTIFFMVGLVLSGATALPLSYEVEKASSWFGDRINPHSRMAVHVSDWLGTVRAGIHRAAKESPFLFYGTDWLAFGHFVIAIAFAGALRDPVRNRWLFQFGMIACAAVPVWAFIMGPIRGVPFWWRCIDASFGIVGFIPLWCCHRWTIRMERAACS